MATFETNFELREVVKDTITEFEGAVIGITFWMNGCVRIGVQPKALKDGKTIDPEWFDDQQLVSNGAPEKAETAKRGGPMPDPVR